MQYNRKGEPLISGQIIGNSRIVNYIKDKDTCEDELLQIIELCIQQIAIRRYPSAFEQE